VFFWRVLVVSSPNFCYMSITIMHKGSNDDIATISNATKNSYRLDGPESTKYIT